MIDLYINLIGDKSFRLYHPILSNIGLSQADASGNGILLRKKIQLALFRIFKVYLTNKNISVSILFFSFTKRRIRFHDMLIS